MSRFDSIGMFWADEAIQSGKRTITRVQPPIPDTGWRPPRDFPNLSAARVISIDTETKDVDLEDHGPGWGRGSGHLVGISMGTEDGHRWYFPMRHEIEPEDNMNPENVLAFARDALGRANQPKVGANISYDVGWLQEEGVEVKGQLIDVQYAEALLDERAQVNLDTLGEKYLGLGKESSLLYRWCADFYGGAPTGKQRANIYRTPPRLTGPYAESDADIPLRVAEKQYPLLHKEGLIDLFNMECGMIRLMMKMRLAGVRVDLAKAEELQATLLERSVAEKLKIRDLVGFDVDINSAESLARAFDHRGLRYGKTAKSGKPSFTKSFLEGIEDPLADHIREIRKCEKLRGTFVESYILNSHIGGRVHGQFHPLRGDATGTRSGRFSSSTPNLQNLPSRDEELAPMVRGLFIPDEGHRLWRRYDYSQIEYRFLIHYAVNQAMDGSLTGADKVREFFNAHPETDYHEMTLDMVAPIAGWDVSTKALRKFWRKPIKNINFGLIYGMGVKKLSADLGLSSKEGKDLFEKYHQAVPFARATMDSCIHEARSYGTISTILGRKSRFDLWEQEGSYGSIALPYEVAVLQYRNLQRAHTHKALNRRLQGSAADLMKKAMYDCWTQGVFDETGVPRLTVHDELDFSDPGGKDDAFRHMQHIMETAIPLSIPVKADYEAGLDWGHCEKVG